MAFTSKPWTGKSAKVPRAGEEFQRSSTKYSAKTRQRDKPAPPAPGSARRYMMWLLSRREYAAADLRKKALTKGHLPAEVEEALTWFQSLGLQDDTRYAGMKARQCAPRYGNRRVEQTLKSKNINNEIVAQQLEELPVEEERAERLIEQFGRQVWDQALQQKVWRRLASRGFSTSTIKSSLEILKQKCAESAQEHECGGEE